MKNNIKPNIDRIKRDIEALAEITDPHGKGHTRISFSKEDLRARAHMQSLMEKEAGLTVRYDAAANMIGCSAGQQEGPCIIIGSHLDTVLGGGRFDGIAGVIAGLEVARRFREETIALKHPLEIVVFLAEEPSPFGMSTIGSRGMAGQLDRDTLKKRVDREHRTLFDAIRDMGGDPEQIKKAQRLPGDILLNLELHIEQGPILTTKGIDIGIVTGIVGIYRGNINISGRMDHAGTTPMNVRNDALTAAAEVVLGLETICKQSPGVVGTTGTLDVYPNASNVIPSTVTIGMEMRSLDQNLLVSTIKDFTSAVELIQRKRSITINTDIWSSADPVHFEQNIRNLLASVCRQTRISHLELPSGAGHDASHMADLAPTGMLFIPCRNGRSHCPEEWAEFEHIGRGVEVLAQTILRVDKEG